MDFIEIYNNFRELLNNINLKNFKNLVPNEKWAVTEKFNKCVELYTRLLHEIRGNSYDEYVKNYRIMLNILEDENYSFLIISTDVYNKLITELIKDSAENEKYLDNSIFDIDIDSFSEDDIIKIAKKCYNLLEQKEGNNLVVTEENFDIKGITDDEKKIFIAITLHSIESEANKLVWSKDDFGSILNNLVISRAFAKSLKNVKIFYFLCGSYLDRLITSDLNQSARDFTEALVKYSFIDEICYNGFLKGFQCYSRLRNPFIAIFYLNLSLYDALQQKNFTAEYLKKIVEEGIKFFRNIGNFALALKHYSKFPIDRWFKDYEKRSLEIVYYSILLKKKDPDFEVKIINYLNTNRELLIKKGELEVKPWLILINNAIILCGESDLLTQYKNLFKSMCNFDESIVHKSLIEGGLVNYKNAIKHIIKNISNTRYEYDLRNDNEVGIIVSNNLVREGVNKSDLEAVFLGMVLKSDYAITFNEQQYNKFEPMYKTRDFTTLETLYNDPCQTKKLILRNQLVSLIILASDMKNAFTIHFTANVTDFKKLGNDFIQFYKNLIKNDFFLGLVFNSETKDFAGNREKNKDELEREEVNIINKTKNLALSSNKFSNEIFVVKDMGFAQYPHNLLLTANNDLLAKDHPITNILSIEWYLENIHNSAIKTEYTKKIWIPTKAGDLTIAKLYSSLEQILTGKNFDIDNEVYPINNKVYDLQIVCSHGAKDIAINKVIVPADGYAYAMSGILSAGKILILLVCFAGSYKKYNFGNDISSIVKSAIKNGYKAVIAPAWALNICIPPIWLETFLDSFNRGTPISYAVFEANKRVLDKYPSPKAWACMHLYGNPTLKLDS